METRRIPVADYPYPIAGLGQAPDRKQLSVLIFFFLLRNERQLFTKAWATCCSNFVDTRERGHAASKRVTRQLLKRQGDNTHVLNIHLSAGILIAACFK